MRKRLAGKVAVVAGGSRGAGKGIALALGEAGATVYVAGRTTERGWQPRDGAPGSVEATAAAINERGGVGIAVPTDCTVEEQVAALFARVEREQGRVDVLANATWAGADAYATMEEWQATWGQPFFAEPASRWQQIVNGSAYAYYVTSVHAARLMAKHKKGLIVGITDGFIVDAATPEQLSGEVLPPSNGQVLPELAHMLINQLQRALAIDLKGHKIAVITLMPGFMRTERVERMLTDEKMKQQFRYDLSESTLYVGRAVAALAGDSKVLQKSGRVHFVSELAREYGFTDADGTQPRFALSVAVTA